MPNKEATDHARGLNARSCSKTTRACTADANIGDATRLTAPVRSTATAVVEGCRYSVIRDQRTEEGPPMTLVTMAVAAGFANASRYATERAYLAPTCRSALGETDVTPGRVAAEDNPFRTTSVCNPAVSYKVPSRNATEEEAVVVVNLNDTESGKAGSGN